VEFGHLDAVAALIYGIRHVTMQPTYVARHGTTNEYYDESRDKRRKYGAGVPLHAYFGKS